MLNNQMILTALEHYGSYMYYAYNSDSLRSQDAENLCKYIETALQSLIFTNPDDEKVLKNAQFISNLLNDAYKYAQRLKYVLCRPKNFEQEKIVYKLIAEMADLTFIPNLYITMEVK